MSAPTPSETFADVCNVAVIVVGAGPVGAALAGDLGTRGVRTLLVDGSDGTICDPRLHAVNVRTMELARRWHITDELRGCGWPTAHPQDIVYVTSLAGHELGRINWPAIGQMTPPPESPTFAQRCPQTWFNAILHRFAKRQDTVDLRFLNRVESAEQDAEGVRARIRDVASDRLWVARAKYIVACDGARSFVREALGIDRHYASTLGHSAEIAFRSPALARMTGAAKAGRYCIVQSTGLSKSLLPIDGKDLYRMTLIAEGSRVTREQIVESIRESIGGNVPFEPVNDVIPWVSGVTSAERFREGRIFLAGDAAHTMPTTGGMGMNTGILDALDLSWKLQACLDGWGGEALLQSYEIERRQAADRTSLMASEIYRDWIAVEPEMKSNGHLLKLEGAEGDAYREKLGRRLVQVFKREFNSIGGALGYRYNDSPICVADGSDEPDDSLSFYVQSSRPGHRAPHLWLSEERSVLDLFGDGFVILQTGGADSDGAVLLQGALARGVPAKVHRLPGKARALYPSNFTIVRPDGHVGWRGDESIDAGRVWSVLTGHVVEVRAPATV